MFAVTSMIKWVWHLFIQQSIQSKRREMIDTAERNLFEARRAKEDAQCIIDYNVKRLKALHAEAEPAAVKVKPHIPKTPTELMREFAKRETAGFAAVEVTSNNGSSAIGSATPHPLSSVDKAWRDGVR